MWNTKFEWILLTLLEKRFIGSQKWFEITFLINFPLKAGTHRSAKNIMVKFFENYAQVEN